MSLYNDIRPTTLDEVVGQDNIKNQLKGVIASGNIPNAFLLTGPRGTGKTTIARIIARTLNCENGGSEPCGECQSCKDILNGVSYDVVELDAASNNKVEDVRGIIEKAQYAPMGKFKVFILDEVHMFSTGAWNALLKLIEEPPAGVVFILCTTEEHKVPATIISRCRKFYFEKIDLDVVAEYLASVCESYGKAYESDALKLIAQASEGCMRDALSIMESFFDTDSLCTDVVADTLGMSDEDAVFGILDAISNADATQAIFFVREQADRGKSAQLLVKAIIGAITDTMFVLNGAEPFSVVNTTKYKEYLSGYASKTDMNRCLALAKALGEVYGTLTKVPDALFLIESSLIRTISVESAAAVPMDKINDLERRLAALEKSGVSVVSTNVVPEVPKVEESQNVVDFPSAPVEEQINGIEMPVFVEDTSSMDFSSDVPFEEDTFFIPQTDNVAVSEPAATVESNDTTPVVDTVIEAQPINNNADGFVGVSEDDSSELDDLFSHLPQGTIVKTDNNISSDVSSVPVEEKTVQEDVAPADVATSVENVEESPFVGEDEPMVKADNGFTSVGFDGFADWL